MKIKKLFLFFFSLCLSLLFVCTLAESPLRGFTKEEGYQYISLGNYSQGEKGETAPILWRVLAVNEEEIYLLSEYVLGSRRVHPDDKEYVGFDAVWALTDMYDFLNNTFAPEVFTAQEDGLLLHKADLGKVFLPNTEDLKNTSYGFSSDKLRQAHGTAHALEQGLFRYSNSSSPYWTRDRSTTGNGGTRCTKSAGNIGYIRCVVENLGWRPGVYLNPSLVEIAGGSGTLEDPFVLNVSLLTSDNQPIIDNGQEKEESSSFSLVASTPLPTLPASKDSVISYEIEPIIEPIDEKNQQASALDSSEEILFSEKKEKKSDYISRPPFTYKNDGFLRPSTFPPLPPTDDRGFLQEEQEEYVYEDDQQGLWLYLSPSLHIEIQRVTDPQKPLVWYEADIRSNVDAGEVLKHIPNDPEKWNKGKHVDAAQIASANHVVFAMNSDYYTYRIARKIAVGIEIRDGKVISEKTVASPRQSFPNLDTMAFYPNGTLEVYLSDELTAKEYVSKGAYDVISFGPILIKDGVFSEAIESSRFGQTKQPRCAIGMIDPGHYYAVLMEGRMNKISTGDNLTYLAHLMMEANCQNAINLDGGQTAVMLFMGKQISRIGSYNGGKTNSRTTTDILGIGHSLNTHPFEEKKK
ncbi:MAG: phosphodiester glycosidase family protein [Clostridiales bacterium]|nr:phosphodiester glycosidase family protein [Clostridiales bacterium]